MVGAPPSSAFIALVEDFAGFIGMLASRPFALQNSHFPSFPRIEI